MVPRLSALNDTADRPMCKVGGVVLQSLENITRIILAKTGSYSPKKITVRMLTNKH